MHLHKWTEWVAVENYHDVSFGDEMPSTTFQRQCVRCHIVKAKHAYGVWVPVPGGGA